MTLKRRVDRLEDQSTQKHPAVFVWGDAPEPDGLKPGQEVVRIRWKGDYQPGGPMPNPELRAKYGPPEDRF